VHGHGEGRQAEVGLDHPARYALVEIENVHDEGLGFEPIHRVLFGLQRDLLSAMRQAFDGQLTYTPVKEAAEMVRQVGSQTGPAQASTCSVSKRSWPAGTGVCVVKMLRLRTCVTASA